MRQNKIAKNLTTDSIYKLIVDIALPSSIGLLFHTLYNVVDTYFAGQHVGTNALAGITLGFPIYFILIAITSGIGNGTTALASIALGKKSSSDFHAFALNASIVGLILSVLFFAFKQTYIPFLFKLSGASGDVLFNGVSYINTIFFGIFFFMLNSIINALLTAQGDTKSYRNFLIFGFFLNVLLDPLFIMGWWGLPELGTFGVALATVLIQLLGMIYLFFKLLKSESFHWVEFKAAKVSFARSKELLGQGIPSILSNAASALGVFVINYFIVKIAPGATTIAAYGAAMRVEQLVLIPTMGLNTAAITLVGQNYGAGLIDRVKETKHKTLLLGITFIVVGALIIYPLIRPIIGLFNSDTAVIEAGWYYLHIEIFALPTYIILGLYTSVLQGVKKPNWAIFIGLYRQIIMPILIFSVLLNAFPVGIKGIWFGIVFINWSATIFTFFYAEHVIKKLAIKPTL